MEADTARPLYAEHAADAFDDIEGEACMLPVFILAVMHVEGDTFDFPELHIRITDDHGAFLKAHGAGAIAAAAGLVEDEISVLLLELPYKGPGRFCRVNGLQLFHLEESFWRLAIADEHILRLLIMTEHHKMVLTADAAHLIAAECSVGRVVVIGVHPYTACLDGTPEPVCLILGAGPYARAEAIQCIVGNGDRFVIVLVCCDSKDRSENLFLEYPHLIVTLEDGRFEVVAAFNLPIDLP